MNALPGWGIVVVVAAVVVLLSLVEDHVVAVECDGEEMVARMQDLWSIVPIQENSS